MMEGLVAILALALVGSILFNISQANSREERIASERRAAEKQYLDKYKSDKADFENSFQMKKLNFEKQIKKLSSERDRALAKLEPLENNNQELRVQNAKYYQRICELESAYGKFIEHPDVAECFLKILSYDTDTFVRYMESVQFYFRNQKKIKNRFDAILPAEYDVGKTDVIAHLSDEHILSVPLPEISVANIVVQGKAGEYSTSLVACTCQDFTVRKRPCKHMLALAKQLDLMWLYGSYISSEINARLRKLIKFSQEKEIEVATYNEVLSKRRIEFEQALKIEREAYLSDVFQKQCELSSRENSLSRRKKMIEDKEKALSEKSQAYPWLASRLAELEMRSLNIKVRDPVTKKEMESRLHKQFEENASLRNQLAVYEYLFPLLEEFKEIEPANAYDLIKTGASDEVFHYQWLSEDEYDVLTSSEKSERWIQRYFNERSKTAWEAGIKYERYIGYLCEKEGYTVKYNGALTFKEDMGRDLIVSKGSRLFAVQCKRFSKEKEIHENHIFQLLGSVIHLRSQYPRKTVAGVFVTSSRLSDVARECADIIGITVFEDVSFKEYPIIKCNIGRDKEKIYHLPYDQQYDRISIDASKGEAYVCSCKEAEELGFRHAWRHTYT